MNEANERDEKNRKIMQFLGYWEQQRGSAYRSQWHLPTCSITPDKQWGGVKCDCPFEFPDFYYDETANAMLLEAMRKPLLVSDWPGCEGWRVDLGVAKLGGKPIGPTSLDRKTAICEAFIKWKESQK